MVILFFLMIVFGLIFLLVGVNVFLEAFEGMEALLGLIGFFVGLAIIIGGAVGLINNVSNYNEETVRLCDAKHGVVSRDGHCFVNNRPVEFSPGVWER